MENTHLSVFIQLMERLIRVEETVTTIILSNLAFINSFNVPFKGYLHLEKLKAQHNITKQFQY